MSDGALEVAFGHIRGAEIPALQADERQRLGFARGDAHRLFKAAFSGGVVITKTMKAAHLQVDGGVGRIQTAGTLEQPDVLLKILLHPCLLGGLKNPVQGAFGNQGRSLHNLMRTFQRILDILEAAF